MVEGYRRQSPLAHRGLAAAAGADAEGAGLLLAERRFLAKIGLRGRATSRAVRAALGTGLPREANTTESGNGLLALWLGPDEWLIVGPPGAEAAIEACLVEALAASGAAVVDVTEGRTAIRLAGPMARDVLAMGCPLDLHPRAFATGRCAQSFLARSTVILHRAKDGVFDLYVERSQADYLWTWLRTAAAPYGCATAPEPPMPANWRRPPKRRSGR